MLVATILGLGFFKSQIENWANNVFSLFSFMRSNTIYNSFFNIQTIFPFILHIISDMHKDTDNIEKQRLRALKEYNLEDAK